MDGNLYLTLGKQIEALKETLSALIDHRETITNNNDLCAIDIAEMVEPVDAQILAAIDGIAELTKHLPPQSKSNILPKNFIEE